MDHLRNIVERCHQRRDNPLRQQRTMVVPALYNKGYLYQSAVYCAQRYPVLLADLEQANISFMPIGRAPDNDRGPRDFGGERFLRRQGVEDWNMKRWRRSWGIQVYTGIPSERHGARWHDIHFTYRAISAAPDATFACVDALVNAVDNPLLTLSKSGGLRFSCRVPDYLHSNTEDARLYIYKHAPTPENPSQRDIYIEIFGEKGYSQWDARYEILLGNLLDPPVVAKEILFAPINTLRAELHEPTPLEEQKVKDTQSVVSAASPSLGSHNLDLAKKAFVKRGFSYLRQENGFHYWIPPHSPVDDRYVVLWESDGIVWIRASTPDVGLPMEATPITKVWENTGIVWLASTAGFPISDEMLAVREGKLSPLAIKRPPIVLQQPEYAKRSYGSPEKDAVQMQRISDGTARILGLITTKINTSNDERVSYFLNSSAIYLNMSSTVALVEKAERHYQSWDLVSLARWKTRMYQWERVKGIPVDVRMAAPFQHGNVCEDPERCAALEEKGGNPDESICPRCPVYAECQEKGYLSQPAALQHAKVQVLALPQLFCDPQSAELLEEILKEVNETERLCIISGAQAHTLFSEYRLSKKLLEEWSVNWRGCALGDFASTLLHTVEIKNKPYENTIKQIRTVMQMFEWREKEIIKQMSHINVQGKVVERGFTDSDTGKRLADFTIEFEDGASAYIPLDNDAADRLRAKRLPVFLLHSFVLNEDLKILIPITQAIELGILEAGTVESIQEFPTVCRNSDWTFWHQLKFFFAHYTRNADAPMRWHDAVLRFWVPPVLPPSLKRFVLMSTTLHEQHLRKAFPNEEIQIRHTKPTAWVEGNRVFQIRTGNYSLQTIVGHKDDWDVMGMSKIGQRFFAGIQAEIEKNPSAKHAIITYKWVAERLDALAEKRNVRFVTDFGNVGAWNHAFEDTQVVWILGTPQWLPRIVWQRAQILFGDDEEPLSYEEEIQTGETYRYKDKRLQGVYEQVMAGHLIRIILRTGLDRWTDKKVVLISSLALPNITDRPETLLFDWEDFEIAGSLDKLPEVIATRERFEAARDNLTAESSRGEVERILGCSSRQANRMLKKFRGGKPLRIPFREQILSILASDGKKETGELVAAIDGHPKAVNSELSRLVEAGEIVRIRRGVYDLPSEE